MTTALVVDASCDIPHSLIEDYGITVMPVSIFTNGHETLDWRTPETTLNYYRNHLVDKNNAVTTQPVTAEAAIKLLREDTLQRADYVVVQTTMGLAGASYLGPEAFSVGLSCAENEWSFAK